MRHGRLLLAGDAAHTVPPTGAKGLNLALADVRVLAEVLERAVRRGDADAPWTTTPRAPLARVWKAQHFSYWMTTMLHTLPGATASTCAASSASLSRRARWPAPRTWPRPTPAGLAASGTTFPLSS